MAWYIARRLLQMIPVFFGATLLIYFLIWKVTGGSVTALAGQRTLTPALEAQLKAQYGLDKPFW
ncbi:ABC transporter permease, partial [Streptomyces sp. NPDC059071]